MIGYKIGALVNDQTRRVVHHAGKQRTDGFVCPFGRRLCV